MQADLLRRFDDDAFSAYVEGMLYASHVNPEAQSAQAKANTRLVLQSMIQHVKMADAYRVTDEMSALVQFAASKLEDSDRYDRTMVPTPWGIVRFDRPLPIKDARGKILKAHWMTWGPAAGVEKSVFGVEQKKSGHVLSWWNDTMDPDEVEGRRDFDLTPKEYAEYRKTIGRWSMCGAELVLDGTKMGGPLVDVPIAAQAQIIAEGGTPAAFTNTQRYAHALFFLLNQTITTTSEEVLPRSAHRRLGRMPIPGRVSVITLRRSAGAQHEGETFVEWSHRWLVRGFPAWRQCGADKPGAVPYDKGWRVRIWVDGYIKGPPDKPLVFTRKVYNLSR
jgi:hypothetical protein